MLQNNNSQAATALLCYCFSSILMTVTNKLVLSHYEFHLNFLLLAIQSLVCVGLLMFFNAMGALSYKPLHFETARRWFPVSLALVAM